MGALIVVTCDPIVRTRLDLLVAQIQHESQSVH